MFRLPLKYLVAIVISLSIFIFPFVKPKTLQAQINPQDVYNGTYENLRNSNRATRDAAAEKQKPLVTGQDTIKYHLGTTAYSLACDYISCCDPDPKYCNPNVTALGNITLAMNAMIANPPASFAWYMQDVLAHAGFIKPAYAQGIGFASMSPLLTLWKAARNVAYSVIIIVMIAIGFMIIFRTKIDPKTVISIQAALPKVVIALILITFSYAIVGFLIDIMYLSMLIMIDILARGMGDEFIKHIPTLQKDYASGGLGVLGLHIFINGFSTLDNFVNLLKNLLGGVAAVGATYGGISATVTTLIAGITGFWGGFGLGLILGPLIVGGIFILILALSLLYIFIRFAFLLFNSYIQILISLILGPIILLQEAVPGKSAFGNWMLNIISNLIVFPATVAVLMFSSFIATSSYMENMWEPPLIGIGGGKSFAGFLTLAILFMGPGLIISLKKSFKAKPAMPISAGSAFAPATGGAQSLMGGLSQFYYLKSIADMIKKRGH